MFQHAIIYAGGFGRRLKFLSQYVPKGLVKINNTPLIDYGINFLKSEGVHSIYVTYGFKGDQLIDYLHNKVSGFINTTDKDNSYFLFNTFVKYIDQPILIMPCDIIIEMNLAKLYQEYIKHNSPIHAIIPTDIKNEFDGDFIQSQDSIITKLDRKTNTGIVASGLQIVNPKKLNDIINPKENFYDVWQQLIEKKQLTLINQKPIQWKAYDRMEQLYE